ncbi:MAG TPA: hypothetical protein VHP56_06410 [Solirubrobacterales bacterium]|nr:hypothetical protein [Solirubrobacterales bacterium]
MRRATLIGLAIAAVSWIVSAGCGGGGGGQTASSTPVPSQRSGPLHPKSQHDSGGGSEQFIVKGADNSVQEFGEEASAAEFEQAARALHGFLDARAERNWAAACDYLSRGAAQGVRGADTGSAGSSCAATLAVLSGKVPSVTLREAAIADVGSLRREGDHGFAIYRGAGGTVYAIPMGRERNTWKVASIAATPLS